MTNAKGALFAGEERTPIGLRGLHLDPTRHFIRVETVLRVIDAMAAIKLNVLHLHLSDAQAFPVEFASFPAYHTEPFWTIADQERIAAACHERGIAIIPEIDMPGHTRAFLSFVDPTIQPETELGIITEDYIEIERDLPVLLAMFDELVTRFGSKYIHMGGDEAISYERFPELIDRVCAWAAQRNLEVIAWDEVLYPIDSVPDNLIIQRWRSHPDPKIEHCRVIVSKGYYLDHCRDPFSYYEGTPPQDGELIGCIACMWTELVTDRTLECTIFPSLYLIAHRWWTFPETDDDLPVLLRRLCETYGYPPAEIDSWQTRRLGGAGKDDPRAYSTVNVNDPLDRDQDLYPTYSRALVVATDTLYRFVRRGDEPTTEERETFLRLGQQACGKDLAFVFEHKSGWKHRLLSILPQHHRSSDLHNNGFRVAIEYALRACAD